MAASAVEKTLTGIRNLIRLLPTGTVFLFQFLSPILTNSGYREPINKKGREIKKKNKTLYSFFLGRKKIV
uniref:Uncharacterized protein n=1 Tax=Cucumis melo TaxID=3656 RepID=A0A9I9CUG4_CUCME